MEPQKNDNNDQFLQFPIPPNQPVTSDIIYQVSDTNIPIYESFMQQQPNGTDLDQFNLNQHRASLPNIQKPFSATSRRHTEGSITITKNNKKRKASSSEETSDSKRKEFLERNRQAALKCRQRKKQWLADLQQRVEYLTSDNEQLQSQATYLREQVLNLKTLLLAHVDCKVAQSNGTTASVIQSVSNLSSLNNNFPDNQSFSDSTNFQF